MKRCTSLRIPHQLARAAALLAVLATLAFGFGGLSAKDQVKDSGQPAASIAADTAKQFLGHLDKGDVNAATALWDRVSVNEKLKARLEKMAAKVSKAGGIKKVDAEPCEERRIKKFEEQTGEKIDVVPVEIICGDGNLMLAVFSIRQKEGAFRIFQLESLKEWGGTASLDDELAYSH